MTSLEGLFEESPGYSARKTLPEASSAAYSGQGRFARGIGSLKQLIMRHPKLAILLGLTGAAGLGAGMMGGDEEEGEEYGYLG